MIAVTALAMPAVPMIPTAQLGNMKVASISLRDSAKPLDFDMPASGEPFHALMQISSDAGEVPKTKSAKRNAASNLTAAGATATSSNESRLLAVWAPLQSPPPPEPVSAPAVRLTLRHVLANAVTDVGHGDMASDPGLATVSHGSETRYGTAETAYLGSPQQTSRAAGQTSIQTAAQDLRATSSKLSTEDKPTASRVEIAKSIDAPTLAIALDKPMSAAPVADTIPASVTDSQTTDATIEGSLPPAAPAKDIGTNPPARILVQPLAGTPQESTKGGSHASRPAAVTTSAHRQYDGLQEQPQTRVTPSPGLMTALTEPAPHIELTPHNEAALHREPATHGEPALPTAKPVVAPIAPKQPVDISGLTQVTALASSDTLTEFVPNMVQGVPVGDAQTAKVSFEAHLWQTPQVQIAAQEIDRAPSTLQQQPFAPERSSQQASNTPRLTPGEASTDKHSQQKLPERQAKLSASEASAPTAAETLPQVEVSLHAEAAPSPATSLMAAPIMSHTPPAPGAAIPVTTPLPSDAPAAGTEIVPAADHAPAPSPASDIKIALNDNGQRVELRVTERAGDIHVTVRTPDSQLATAMREDLPALSSRLEQSGFHSEMWHPAASPSTESKMVEVSSGNTSYDSREQQGGGQGQEDPQQNHKNSQQTFIRKSNRKEFSWLLESIR